VAAGSLRLLKLSTLGRVFLETDGLIVVGRQQEKMKG
jgi:hypothetical protein